MIPRILLDTAEIPGSDDTLRLFRRGDEFAIMLGGVELMNSGRSGSEEALATMTCERLDTMAPSMLIGGLGMGFTLRAALTTLGDTAEIVVAELVPAVVAWARAPMAALHGGSLDDPRVLLRESDVGALIRGTRAAWDAILLDVDNGPDGLTLPSNDRLYDRAGLAAARAALRPGGVLAIWSSAPDKGFTRRLIEAGFAVEEATVRAHRGRGVRDTIWFATIPR
jgi:spermidine synthase